MTAVAEGPVLDDARQLWMRLPPDTAAMLRPHIIPVADHVLRELRRLLPELGRPAGSAAVTVEAVSRTIRQCLAATGPSASDPAAPVSGRDWAMTFRAIGRKEFRAGRSLDRVLSAYRVAGRSAWRYLASVARHADLGPELICMTAEAIFATIEEICSLIVSGYSEERVRSAGTAEPQRARLLALLLSEPAPTSQEIATCAEAAGCRCPALRSATTSTGAFGGAVSKRNREKRAAKKRTRQQRGPTPPRGDFGFGSHDYDDPGTYPPPIPPAEELAHALLAAARAGNPADASARASELATGYFARAPHVVGTAAGMVLAGMVGRLWRAGWLPTDAWEITRRRTDTVTTSLLVDTIAADTAQHASQMVHERWLAQVRQLDADVWWNRDRPHLLQWAQRHQLSVEQALLATITLLGEFAKLPRLPQILPPPGTTTHRPSAEAAGVDQKILSRVRALLAKAESTQFPAEAEALSAKAQELMNRYAFERALLDVGEHKPQAATSTRLWLDSPYLEAKSHLVTAIADANRCKSIFHPDLGFVAVVGDPLDLDITELLVTSLLVQATRAMVAEGSQITRTGTSRTRSFRQSFLIAYAARIGERLKEAGSQAADQQADDRLLPVLADRARVVEGTFREMYSHTVAKSVSVSNGAGWQAGRAAADRADLTIERRALIAT